MRAIKVMSYPCDIEEHQRAPYPKNPACHSTEMLSAMRTFQRAVIDHNTSDNTIEALVHLINWLLPITKSERMKVL